jgi:hypothetical protein
MSGSNPCLRILLALGILFSACGGGGGGGESLPDHLRPVATWPTGRPPTPPGDPSDPAKTEVEVQRELWESRGVANYRYTLQRTVFSGPQYTDAVVVEVRNGLVVSRTYAGSGAPVTVPDAAAWWPAIDGLFDIIEDARAAGAAVAQATYDPVYGFPTWGTFDGNPGLADDEHSFTAGSFSELP